MDLRGIRVVRERARVSIEARKEIGLAQCCTGVVTSSDEVLLTHHQARHLSARAPVGAVGLVGAPGIEPGTSTSQKWRATAAPRPA